MAAVVPGFPLRKSQIKQFFTACEIEVDVQIIDGIAHCFYDDNIGIYRELSSRQGLNKQQGKTL